MAEIINFIFCLFSFNLIPKVLINFNDYITPNKWICCNLYNQSASVGYLGCFYFFTIINDATVNNSVPESFFFTQNFIKIDAHKWEKIALSFMYYKVIHDHCEHLRKKNFLTFFLVPELGLIPASGPLHNCVLFLACSSPDFLSELAVTTSERSSLMVNLEETPVSSIKLSYLKFPIMISI